MGPEGDDQKGRAAVNGIVGIRVVEEGDLMGAAGDADGDGVDDDPFVGRRSHGVIELVVKGKGLGVRRRLDADDSSDGAHRFFLASRARALLFLRDMREVVVVVRGMRPSMVLVAASMADLRAASLMEGYLA